MSVAGELLSAAKDLLLKGRTKGALARDKDGNAVDPSDETAERFSVQGALQRAAWERRSSTGYDTALALLQTNSIQDPHFDGFSTHASDEDLTKRFDDAIAAADGNPVEAKQSTDEEKSKLFDPLSGGGEAGEFDQREARRAQTQSEPQTDERAQHDAERVREGLDQSTEPT